MKQEIIRILYVDDYPLDRALVRDALINATPPFELVEASSRDEFENLLPKGGYHLVLSDFNILGYTGLQVLDAVHQQLPGTPVIIVTGTGSEEVAAEAIKRGAADYIIKSPSQIRRLPHIIIQALENQRLRNERFAAEHALRESEEKYRLLFEHAEVLISIYDRAGTCLLMNRVLAVLYGGLPEDFIGKSFYDLHPEKADLYIGNVQKVIDTQEIFEYENEVIYPTGTHWVLTSIQPVRFGSGDINSAQIISRDITELKQAQDSLLTYTRQLEFLHRASLAFGQLVNPAVIGEQILTTLEEFLDYQRGAIAVFNPLTAELELLAHARMGLDDEAYEHELERVRSFFQQKAGITRFVAENNQIVRLGDVRADPRYLEADSDIRSEMAVPLQIAGRVIGVINVESTILDAFSDEDERLLTTLANQAAIAIQNIQDRAALLQRSQELQLLTVRLAEAEEAERRRLARELHDQVGQSLAVLGLNINLLREFISPGNEIANLHLSNTEDTLTEISTQIRGVMDDLRPSILDDYGLFAALNWFADRFSGRTGIKTQVSGRTLVPRLDHNIENALFRITQEALSNVTAHAKANQVSIRLSGDGDFISLIIKDNGIGFSEIPSDSPGKRRGWGLVNMRERAEVVGATFSVESQPGAGSTLRIEYKREIT